MAGFPGGEAASYAKHNIAVDPLLAVELKFY